MSKPVKNLITESYRRHFSELNGAVLIDIRGIEANDNNSLRTQLAQDGVHVTVVKNSLAKKAFADTPLDSLAGLLEGPSSMVYGGDSVVSMTRRLVDLVKTIPNLELKGALMDGQLFGPDQMDALSKYPTRDEARAQAVQIFLSPGSNLAGQVAGPGGRIASIIKTIQEKLEKGETIKAAS